MLLSWFTWYARRHLRRHFQALLVSRTGWPAAIEGQPLVVFSNHASWWDPLVGLVLAASYFPGRKLALPMDAVMLERYRFFKRLGFFGVEPGTAPGAVRFLRMAARLLDDPNAMLAMTPQGRFADARERPVSFLQGMGWLALRARQSLFIPVATEYVFWDERLPVILVRFGQPISVAGERRTAKEWTNYFEKSLETVQDGLAAEAQARDYRKFEPVLAGSRGVGGIYDYWLRAAGMVRGGWRKGRAHAS